MTREELEKSIERARQRVLAWPQWKRDLLKTRAKVYGWPYTLESDQDEVR